MKQGTIKYILLIVVGLLCALLQQASAYCPSGKFLCQSGECIPADNKCDGFNHCNDGSDEVADAGCGYTCYVCSDCEFNYATSQTCRYGCQKFVITRDIAQVCYVCQECELTYSTTQNCHYGCLKTVIHKDIGFDQVSRSCASERDSFVTDGCIENDIGDESVTTCFCKGNRCNSAVVKKMSATLIALFSVIALYLIQK